MRALALAAALAAPAAAQWATEPSLAAGYIQTKTVAGGGYLYKLGGLGDKGICGTRDVQYAAVGADGALGAWKETTPLPDVGSSTMTWTCGGQPSTVSDVVIGWGYEAAYSNGRVYLLGGNRWAFNFFPDGIRIHFSSETYSAPVNADGSLGAWVRGPDLPYPVFNGAAAVANGVVYLTGGRDSSTTAFVHRDALYARVGPDGTLGAWKDSPSLMPGGLWLHAAAVAGGRLYVAGGVTYDPFPLNQITNGVWSAPLAADGTPGDWRAETALPTGLAGHGLKERHGILYTLGGDEPYSPSVSVRQSSVAADGTLPAWTDADYLPVPLYTHGHAALGSALYAVGGTDGITPQKGAYRLPDRTPPAAIADLAAAPLDSASVRLTWTAPGDDGAYGAVNGGSYRLSVAADPSSLGAVPVRTWTASFAPGDAQSWRLAGLTPGTNYFLSLAAVDPAGNAAPPSNVASAQTYFLAVSPENPPVVRVESPVAGLSVAPLNAFAAATLLASAPGAAAVPPYQISPSAALNPGLLTVAVPAAALVPGAALYEYVQGVGWSSAAVAGQSVDAAAGLLRGTLAATGVVAVFGPAPVPAVSALTPSLAAAGSPAFTLTVDGAGFVPTSVVLWNGAARATTFVSATRLAAAIGAADVAAPGAAAVTVVTPAPGGGSSGPALFTVGNPLPSLSALTPATATAGGAAFTLTATGASFVTGATVLWNGAPRATTFVSATRLTAAIPAADLAAAGPAAVAVSNPAPGGGLSAALPFLTQNPAPSVSALTPASATAGGAGFTLTVDGAGFVAASTVLWNGAPRATTFVSATRLTAAVSAGDVAAAGTDSVAVSNPAPGGGTSAAASFTVNVPAPLAPVVSALTPAGAVAGSGALTLTVDGANFVAASVVQWNGAARPTAFVSAARLTASLSAADLAAAGADVVTVVTPAPGGGTSAPASFTVSNPAPSVAALTPASAVAGGAAFTLAVDGAGFVPTSAVLWNGSARTTAFVSTTRLTASVTAADVAAAGSASVTVSNPAPGGGVSAAASFAVLNPAPAVATLTPAAATAGAPAFTLTVDGSGFVAGASVLWNGAARATAFVSATRLTASVTAADVAAAGTASVTVSDPAPGGGVSAAASFAVNAPSGGGTGTASFRGEAEPRTLNLGSNGKSFRVALDEDSFARARDVVASSVRLSAVDGRAVTPLTASSPAVGDDDSDGVEDASFAFDRAAVEALLAAGDHVLTVTGLLADGRAFTAAAAVRTIAPGGSSKGVSALGVTGNGKGKGNGNGNSPSASATVAKFWPAPATLYDLSVSSRADAEPFAPAGRAVAKGRAAVKVPQGAVDASVTLTVSTTAAVVAPDAPARERKAEESGLTAAAPPVVFGPEGTRFTTPVTLELPYDRASLPPGTDENSLAVHYWNPSTGEWEKLWSSVDRQAQVVRAQTSHFSLYQVLSVPAPSAIAPAAADVSFGLKAAYAFPNPVHQGAVVIRVQPGLADSVSVRVYDVTGRKVHESSDFASSQLDDGNGLGVQYTYDHAWDVNGVGSGVYTYVVTAKKAGQGDLHKTGRIGVSK